MNKSFRDKIIGIQKMNIFQEKLQKKSVSSEEYVEVRGPLSLASESKTLIWNCGTFTSDLEDQDKTGEVDTFVKYDSRTGTDMPPCVHFTQEGPVSKVIDEQGAYDVCRALADSIEKE